LEVNYTHHRLTEADGEVFVRLFGFLGGPPLVKWAAAWKTLRPGSGKSWSACSRQRPSSKCTCSLTGSASGPCGCSTSPTNCKPTSLPSPAPSRRTIRRRRAWAPSPRCPCGAPRRRGRRTGNASRPCRRRGRRLVAGLAGGAAGGLKQCGVQADHGAFASAASSAAVSAFSAPGATQHQSCRFVSCSSNAFSVGT